MILPKRTVFEDDAPFSVFTLDPRFTFVVYYNGLGNRPMMGVKYVIRQNGKIVFSVYTDRWYFEIEDWKIIKAQPHILGDIPIIEYLSLIHI